MPSKKKSRSKPSPSPSRTPSRHSTAADDGVDRPRRPLEAAAARYPSLLSETEGFIGRISEFDAESKGGGGGATVWVSEASMVAFKPGSLVSVSLADSGVNKLTDEYDGHLGLDDDSSDVGSIFTLATVNPSRELLKDGVKLSWNLRCTMGFPALGRVVFISPLKSCSEDHLMEADELQHLISGDSTCISLCNCKDLYLKLVIPKNGQLNDYAISPPSKTLLKSKQNHSGNAGISSPKTPSTHNSKLAPMPAGTPLSRGGQGSVLNLDCLDSAATDVSIVLTLLEDEKIVVMLQTLVAKLLCSRNLLLGNFVTLKLPTCGQVSFRVEGANKLLSDCFGHDSTLEESQLSNNVNPRTSAFVVDCKTKVHLFASTPPLVEMPAKWDLPQVDLKVTCFKDKEGGHLPKLGGLSKEFSILKEIIVFSIAYKDLLPSYKGVLLHGPPGTGKTSLASHCAHEAGVNIFTINGPEIISQYYGESEKALHEVFESARQSAPSVVFIDELDAIAPAREHGSEELSLRMVGTLLNLMDGVNRSDGVFVIAATNRPDSIDPALRRPGRLDREIEIGVPSPHQRLDILQTLLHDVDHSLSSAEVLSLASATHGFVGADLAALCNEAAMSALRRYIKFRCISGNAGVTGMLEDEGETSRYHVDSMSLSLSNLRLSSKPDNCSGVRAENVYQNDSGERDYDIGESMLLKVTNDDFEKAKMKVRPSAMREVMLEFPKVHWDDIGGQMEAKKQLTEAVQWPQLHREALERIGVQPVKGVLMFGPPGCSKTLMARAVASEAGLNFLAVKGPELFSKWVGDSEKAVRSLFAKARANSPSIIFFDEIDGLATTRGQENDGTSVADRVLSQLLVEMDGLDQRVGVTIIAATNRPDNIDPALLRPGRFDRSVYVGPPNEDDRKDIFRIHSRNMLCSSAVDLRELASLTEGYTGADIKLICREAAIAALEENFDILEISMDHFKAAIDRVHPSDVRPYQELSSKFERLVKI
ncbi:Calmodulin-interacting protein 111 [Acorus gramineus]|uniref:Calmodulin-interacting protein 111 n=1 Tax=Acorus gramineus TaxID=55184 RepID=A0AAV9BKN5_ACOGR|nr:Calmodulin-interacting protein 111 [Acorus gramineus]